MRMVREKREREKAVQSRFKVAGTAMGQITGAKDTEEREVGGLVGATAAQRAVLEQRHAKVLWCYPHLCVICGAICVSLFAFIFFFELNI